jgi:hypothetical protein
MDYPSYPALSGPRVYWSAIFAGSVVSLALMMLFRAFGVSIGASTAPSAGDATALPGGHGLGMPLFLWVCGAAAFYAGGWIASRLSSSGRPSDGVIFGVVSWAASLVAVPFLYYGLVGGHFGAIAFGRIGFGMMLVTGIAAAFGGSAGARLYRPVPIEDYRTTKRETVVSIR